MSSSPEKNASKKEGESRGPSDVETARPLTTTIPHHPPSSSNSAIQSNGHKEPTGFLDLPAELRDKCYGMLLADNPVPDRRLHNPSYGDGNDTDQDMVLVEDLGLCKLHPNILRTCKQVCKEAIKVLYSKNVIYVRLPSDLSDFSKIIGPTNFKDIKTMSLRINEHKVADGAPWLALLADLAANADGLRVLQVETVSFWDDDLPTNEANFTGGYDGLGSNQDFLQALGKIQQLDKLIIKGLYSKDWPEYLRKNMETTIIKAECGEYRNLLKDDEKKDNIWIEKENKFQLEEFEAYQAGKNPYV